MYDMYQEVILQHYRNPRNFGPLPDADRIGEESNPLCGDHITVRLKVDPASHTISQVRFEGDGCAISVASTSMMTEKVAGLTVEEARRLAAALLIQAAACEAPRPQALVRRRCATVDTLRRLGADPSRR